MEFDYLGELMIDNLCHHGAVREVSADVSKWPLLYFLGRESYKESTQS